MSPSSLNIRGELKHCLRKSRKIKKKPYLVLQNASKRYGGVVALDGVDLTILPGEIHGLVGENGSGKALW